MKEEKKMYIAFWCQHNSHNINGQNHWATEAKANNTRSERIKESEYRKSDDK